MTLAELIQNLIDSSKERIKNPIVGAFICSFFICNWKPIFILLFSDLKIEDRIAFVNDKWTLWIPFLFAILYTLAIPLLMIVMDFALMPMKQKRIKNIYANKGYTTDRKIDHADKELALKNAISGNKDRQSLLDQIDALEKSKFQENEANHMIVSNLNDKLEEVNNSYRVASTAKNNEITQLRFANEVLVATENTYRNVAKVLMLFDRDMVNFFKEIGIMLDAESMEIFTFKNEKIEIFERLDLLEKKEGKYNLTTLGLTVYQFLIDSEK